MPPVVARSDVGLLSQLPLLPVIAVTVAGTPLGVCIVKSAGANSVLIPEILPLDPGVVKLPVVLTTYFKCKQCGKVL